MQNTTLAIIVPCLNEQEALPLAHERLCVLLDGLVLKKLVSGTSFILYVDDGSTDDTWQLIGQRVGPRVRGLKLVGNVGQQNALMAGMETVVADADAIVTIDADLQDDEVAVIEMLRRYDDGCDVVYGVRRNRKSDSFFKRTTAQCFYRFMMSMGVKTHYNHADFRLLSRRVVHTLCQYGERSLFLRGLITQMGYRSEVVYYDRRERVAGKSNYSVGKMLSLALDAVTSFSVKPLRLIFYLGAAFLLISLVILVYVIVSLCRGNGVQGWASLMLSIWFVGGCLLMCMSVIAAYVGRIYTEGKHRPRYHIDQYLK